MPLRVAVVESELTSAQLVAVAEALDARGLPPGAWPEIPALRTFALEEAVRSRMGSLTAAGVGVTAAAKRTGAAFGLPFETVRSTWYRSERSALDARRKFQFQTRSGAARGTFQHGR